jgi:hypothetical protein
LKCFGTQSIRRKLQILNEKRPLYFLS